MLHVLQERAELCRALLYAVVLSPNQLQPGTVADILSLLEQLVGKVKAAGEPRQFVGSLPQLGHRQSIWSTPLCSSAQSACMCNACILH